LLQVLFDFLMKEEITVDGSNAGDRWGWMQCD
jgi:hypothetical protein